MQVLQKDLKMEENKIYFMPGDMVKLRQNLPNSPIMLVVKKKTYIFKNKDNEEPALKGILCRWFTDNGQLQEAVFNTKDLLKI